MLDNYDSSSIKILKGLSAVRKRPGMYIGDTYNGIGLHHMVFEIIDNSIDEALAGYCKNIFVKIYEDNSISVLDDGRGIPVDIHKEEGISCAEVIMTVLHSGSKFNNKSYIISGGLHGVGISVVNALSEKLILKIYKNNNIYYQCYKYGVPVSNLYIIGKSNNRNGTYIKFWPDKKIFNNNFIFKYSILFNRLNELSFLNSGLNINLLDKRINKEYNFKNFGGIKYFLKYIVKDKCLLNKKIFYFNYSKNVNLSLEIASCWVNNSNCSILCFTNNISQIDGGTHLIGFKSAVTRTINSFINNEISKRKKINIIGKDTREGLYSIISLKLSNPKFSSQTKDKLISSEIKSFVESLVMKKLYEYLLENPSDSKIIINKIINSYKIRESIRKFREISKKKSNFDLSIISNKLADCQERNSLNSEIFLVEGDSAGGSAKQGRNRLNQAVLPLKGKILNVEKTNLEKVLSSNEISVLISVLGCGIKNDNFNINKLRYNKIIIMTDADVDGSHIRTLLLTFFYRYMKDLIINGHLYIAKPPLYKINNKNKNKNYYIDNENDLLIYKIIFCFKNIDILKNKNIILMKYNCFVKIILSYIKYIKYFLNKKCLFNNFIFHNFMIYKKIDIYNINKCNLWLNNFSKFINGKINYKININILIKKNNFNGLYFTFKNNYIIKKIKFKKSFFLYKYIKILDLSKKLFFIKYNYKKFILLNKKRIYFENILDLINFVLNKKKKYIYIQHYKGLGEMNPNQLWETTMDPKNRFLFKIYIDDFKKSDNLFKTLMGDNVKIRRDFIKNNYKYI